MMKCRECGAEMYRDDVDRIDNKSRDEYWNCTDCQTSCIVLEVSDMAKIEECKKVLNDTMKEYADRFVYADTDSIIVRNEMIISIYDSMYCYSVKINGITPSNEYDICLEFDHTKTDEIIAFMERHNIHRLIVCEDGGIEIYTR